MRVTTAAVSLVLACDLGANAFAFVPSTHSYPRHGSPTAMLSQPRSRPDCSLNQGSLGALRLRGQSDVPRNNESEPPVFAKRSLATDRGRPLILPDIAEDHNAVKLVTDFVKLTSPTKRKMVLEVEGDPEEILLKLRQAGLAEQAVLQFKEPSVSDLVFGESEIPVEVRKEETEDDKTHPSYFKTSLRDLVMRRSGVLTVLLLLQSVSSVVLTNYQALIEQHVFLALFLTMLTGTGGNAGNQSSALVIRGLSTGEIHKGNMWLVIVRELMASSAIAFVLAAAAFGRVLLTPGCTISAALIVALTTYVTVVGAIAGGTIVPLLLDRMGMDPVHLSSPILATITDVMGVLLLCVVTTAALGHL